MTTLYKFQADIKPSLFIVICFIAQLYACCYIENEMALITIGFISIFIPGITAAAYNHHHQHHNIFRRPLLNRLFELILALQTGLSSYAWVLHHNLGHHQHYQRQYSESEQPPPKKTMDESRWTFKNGKIMNFWQYSAIGFCMAYFRVHKSGLKYKTVYAKYLICRVVYYSMIFAGLYYFGMRFVIVFIIPSLIILFFTIGATYKHHTGLRSEDHYSASFSNVNHVYNFITCNLGYHTAHHLRPGLHWSLLPAFHEKICDKIPSALIYDSLPKSAQLLVFLRNWRGANKQNLSEGL